MAVKLTKKDKEILKKVGYEEQDFKTIEELTSYVKIYFEDPKTKKQIRVSKEKARQALGDEDYFSALGRGIFHFSTVRELKNKGLLYFRRETR